MIHHRSRRPIRGDKVGVHQCLAAAACRGVQLVQRHDRSAQGIDRDGEPRQPTLLVYARYPRNEQAVVGREGRVRSEPRGPRSEIGAHAVSQGLLCLLTRWDSRPGYCDSDIGQRK